MTLIVGWLSGVCSVGAAVIAWRTVEWMRECREIDKSNAKRAAHLDREFREGRMGHDPKTGAYWDLSQQAQHATETKGK